MHSKIICTAILTAAVLSTGAAVPGYTIAANKMPEKGAVPQASIGWLHGKCFAVKDPDIQKNTALLVISTDGTQKITPARIIRRARNGTECYGLLEDRKAVNTGSGVTFYRVASKAPIELGIGVVQEKAPSKRALHALKSRGLDLNNDGRRDTFSQCATSEGVRFSVWGGVAYKSRLIWSGDYYLGYDTEVDCPF